MKVLYCGENEFKRIPFLSANWWNRPKAFYGMGLGLIVGQNQRVDQGTINAILKILSYGVNPIYLKTQRRKHIDSDGENRSREIILSMVTVDKAFHLMETPKIPCGHLEALKEIGAGYGVFVWCRPAISSRQFSRTTIWYGTHVWRGEQFRRRRKCDTSRRSSR